MKHYLVIYVFGAVLATAGAVNASVIAEGRLDVSTGTLVTDPADEWTGATFTWKVEKLGAGDPFPGAYRYTYTFDEGQESFNLSHMVVEVSDSFTEENILASDPNVLELNVDPQSPDGEDGGEDGLYGIKWEQGGPAFSGTVTTYREPIWGDVFLKDGQPDAWNSGYFLPDPNDPVVSPSIELGDGLVATFFDENAYGWVAVPDTNGEAPPFNGVPEPGSLIVWSVLGIVGLCVARQRLTT